MDLQETDSSLGGHPHLCTETSVHSERPLSIERGWQPSRPSAEMQSRNRCEPHIERTVFYANAVDRRHCTGCSRALLPITKDHGEYVLLHHHRKNRGSPGNRARKRKAWHTARSSPRDVVSHFVPQYLKRNMGALLSILIGSAGNAGVGKPLHHLETHCDCACSDASESSEESKNKHEPSAKNISSKNK